jgi:hypothetical protein
MTNDAFFTGIACGIMIATIVDLVFLAVRSSMHNNKKDDQ